MPADLCAMPNFYAPVPRSWYQDSFSPVCKYIGQLKNFVSRNNPVPSMYEKYQISVAKVWAQGIVKFFRYPFCLPMEGFFSASSEGDKKKKTFGFLNFNTWFEHHTTCKIPWIESWDFWKDFYCFLVFLKFLILSKLHECLDIFQNLWYSLWMLAFS